VTTGTVVTGAEPLPALGEGKKGDLVESDGLESLNDFV